MKRILQIFSLFQYLNMTLLYSVLMLSPLYASKRSDPNKQLLIAAASGNCYKTQAALRLGADVNSTDNKKRTALHKASLRRHAGVIALLLKEGADVDVIDNYQQTPLHQASTHNYDDIVRLLLKVRANTNIPDKKGRKTLYWTLFKSSRLYYNIPFLLAKYGAHHLNKKQLQSLPHNRLRDAQRCNEIITNRVALIQKLLKTPKNSLFLRDTYLPKVLQQLIINDFLGHKPIKIYTYLKPPAI